MLHWYDYSRITSCIVKHFRIGFAHIGRVGSVAVTVSISIERYINCYYPNEEMPIKSLLVPIPLLFTFLYNVPKFFELNSCNKTNILPDYLTNTTNEFQFPAYLKPPNISENTISSFGAGLNLNISTKFSKNIFPVIPLIQLHNVSEFYIDPYNINEINLDSCPDGYRTTWLRNNSWYIIFYVFWSKFILVEVLPWFTVIILTILTSRKMKEFQVTRDRLIGTHRREFNTHEG